ncbi:sulfite exporter TauE/SafE family protein [Patescibacteria group bacterium]
MELLLISGLVLVASFLGTIIGFGSSIVIIPVFLLFFPLPETLLFAGIIHVFVDIWQTILFKKSINYKVLIYFGVPSVIAGFLGAQMLLGANHVLIIRSLGVLLVIYGVFELIKPNFKLANSKFHNLLGGSVSGFISGFSGIGGPVRSMFLQAFDLPEKQYLFTAGLIALLVDITRISTYVSRGVALPSELKMLIVVLMPISLLSAELAKKVVERIPHNLFKKIVALFLIISGVVLFVRI